jgi:hypothetical protein
VVLDRVWEFEKSTRMANKCSHLEATRALNVHEEAVGALNETLELVVLGFSSSGGVKQILFNLKSLSEKK